MKIGIMTWHYGANHGAILQAYALKKVIEDMGHETVLLPFERNMEHYVPRVISRDEKRLKYSIKGIERKLFHDKKKRIFKSFKNAYFKVVEKGTPVDAVCLGSDEVFDISTGYTPDMFGEGYENVFAYAPTFARTNLEDISERKLMKHISERLDNINDLSARDDNTKNIILELTGRDVEIVLDPTLLYGFDKEKDFSSKYSDKWPNGYIVLYSYLYNFNSKEEIKSVKDFAKANKLPVISLGYYHSWCDECINADPMEFLGIMNNASYVVTDTFHGTVFSILFNRQFCCFFKDYNVNKMSFLLNQFGLYRRRCNTVDELADKLSVSIDYSDINLRLVQMREKSKSYLQRALDNASSNNK